MGWLLRTTAIASLLWAVGLVVAPAYLVLEEQLTPLAKAFANGQAAAGVVFAFAFWRAAGETPANRTVIYSAILLLVFKTAADLYGVLELLDGVAALLSLADLVVCVALSVGLIESLPRALRPDAQAPP